jgi:proline racemase
LMKAKGLMNLGQTFEAISIIGSRFIGWIVNET